MAFVGLWVGFMKDEVLPTQKRESIEGRLLSSHEDTTTVASTETVAIPRNCTHITIFSDTDLWVEIGTGTPDAASGERYFVRASTYVTLSVGPSSAAQKSLAYRTA